MEQRRRGEEERERVLEEEGGQDSDTLNTCTGVAATGKRQGACSYSFTAEEEERLLEFFAANDCFYNKASEQYSNYPFKRNLLEGMARQLNTGSDKVYGWFKNQRTTVGKLYKKSGQVAEALTARKKWQMSSFTFLKQHIVPRKFPQDTGSLPSRDIEEEEPEVNITETESDGASDRALSLGVTIKTPLSTSTPASSERVTKRKGTWSGEDALLEYLSMSRPRTSEVVQKKIESLESATKDERTAFGQWFCMRLLKVPDMRWEEFQDEVQDLLKKYTRPR